MSDIERCWVIERDQDGQPIITGGPDDGEHGIPPEPGYVEVIPRSTLTAERERLTALFHEYVRQHGRLGYDGRHLAHWLAKRATADSGGQ